MTPEQLKKLLPYKTPENPMYFSLPDNFVPGSIAFANFPVRPTIRKVRKHFTFVLIHRYIDVSMSQCFIKTHVNIIFNK